MATPASSTPGTSTPDNGHLKIPGLKPQLTSSSESSLHRLKNVPGYTTPVFKGKEEQRAKVQASVASKASFKSSWDRIVLRPLRVDTDDD